MKMRIHTTRRVTGRVAALAIAGLCLAVPAAHAEYYYTKRGAEKMARDFAADEYEFDYYNVVSACRPQGERSADSRYKYHRWVCLWADVPSDCEGKVLIVGSSGGRGAYYYKVLRGMRCPAD